MINARVICMTFFVIICVIRHDPGIKNIEIFIKNVIILMTCIETQEKQYGCTGGNQMNTVADKNMVYAEPCAIRKASTLLPLDILNREPVIDQMLNIVDLISKNRASYTFALNGAWGTGKTFVLDRIRAQLTDECNNEKYCVFHYNCWQYDYYEEPLIAIVAAMLDSVEDEVSLFPKETREIVQEVLSKVKNVLFQLGKSYLKSKLGEDALGVLSALFAQSSNDQQSKSFDQYSSLKKAIKVAQEQLNQLSQERTMVVIVDEIDRCLPSYAITVLERLHHLFSDVNNCAVILAVDKAQMENTVQQIFGEKVSTFDYLRKFIAFEVPLDCGKIENGFEEKYPDYVSMFEKPSPETDFSFDDFFSAVFSNIEMRTQERIVERVKIAHQLLFSGERKDYTFMCVELMWAVLKEKYTFREKSPFQIRDDGEMTLFDFLPKGEAEESRGELSKYIYNEWSVLLYPSYNNNLKKYTLHGKSNIASGIVWYIEELCSPKGSMYQLDACREIIENCKNELKSLRKFTSLLESIQ